MIEFRNVSKSFWTGTQRKVILDQASFKIELGHSMGILAPNGTGKTTIINMMAGLEQPDEGKIFRTSRISFPLGFMGGLSVATRQGRMHAILPGYTALILIMWRRSADIFPDWTSISRCH